MALNVPTSNEPIAAQGGAVRTTWYRFFVELWRVATGKQEFIVYTPEMFGTADDDTTVQAALTAAGSGGVVSGKTGKTYLVGTTLDPPSGVTLRDIKLKLANSANTDVISLSNGTSGVKLDNVEIDGNKSNNASGLRGITSVAASTVTDIEITHCNIHDCKVDGIGFGGTLVQRVRITDNWVHDNDSDGIDAAHSGTAREFVIDGNLCNDNGKANIGVGAIADAVTISGNTCEGAGGGAVTADNISAYNSSNKSLTVVGNTCHDGANHGMHLGGANVVIAGNVVDNPVQSGIYVTDGDNVTITGNAVDSIGGAAGINCETITDLTVTGNAVRDGSGHGIFINTVTGGTVSGNNATGNTQDGIRIDTCTGIIGTGNRVTGNGDNGIQVNDSSGCTIGPNIVTGNTGTELSESGTSSGNTFIATNEPKTIQGGSFSSIPFFTVADDAAASFTLSDYVDTGNRCMAMLIDNANVAVDQGLFHLNPSGSETPVAITGVMDVTNVNFSNVALAGTTGVDTKTTISVNSGTLYIENRRGSSKTWSVVFFGMTSP